MKASDLLFPTQIYDLESLKMLPNDGLCNFLSKKPNMGDLQQFEYTENESTAPSKLRKLYAIRDMKVSINE